MSHWCGDNKAIGTSGGLSFPVAVTQLHNCVTSCASLSLSVQTSRLHVADTLKSKQNLLEESAKTLSHLEGK